MNARHLQAIGNESIFAIGDCASISWVGGPKEGLIVLHRAQSAHQMSNYLTKHLINIINGEAPRLEERSFTACLGKKKCFVLNLLN